MRESPPEEEDYAVVECPDVVLLDLIGHHLRDPGSVAVFPFPSDSWIRA